MSCERYASEAVHLMLGQGSGLAEFQRHRAECRDCDREAAELESLFRLLRASARQPASKRFRGRLELRLLEEQRLEDEELLETTSFSDRVISMLAYARFRAGRRTALKVVLAAAALYLVAFSIYLTWSGRDRPAATLERETAERPAPAPAPSGSETDPGQDDQLLALERLKPPRPADVIIEPPDFPLPLPEGSEGPVAHEEDFSLETFQEARELTLRENLLATARFRMRHRFSTPGSRPVDRAVLRSLRYLSGEQEPDGSWDPADFGGEPEARVGVTGLCVLAFLVNAERGIPGGLYRQHVDRGLDYLRGSVTANRTIGAVRGDDDVVLFNHAVATLAFAEHYLLRPGSDQALLSDALERLEDLGSLRRFRERQEADNITAPWVALALETARAAGVPAVIDVARAAEEAQSFVAKLVDLDPRSGLAVLPGEQLCAMACASALDSLYDDVRDYDRYQPPINLLLQHLKEPSLREPTKIFFAALDALQRGGIEWQRFRSAAGEVLLASQNDDGSWSQEYEWDPVGNMGGDLYETALAVMVLSVEERIAR